ncbi:PREDICTED: platelet glycoprotein VI, partial [Chrysochloris asiatica]|uniref:Platelet glycoprotein VI n=1 Tax=Chrysochloris asiatica TaxID=185453 RepID=A0A9B0TTE9_CHRAS
IICLGDLIKPSIWAVPGTVIPQRSTVTILCKGPSGMTTMLLRSIGHGNFDTKFLQDDQQVVEFFIQNVTSDSARTYYCEFFNNGNWSTRSDLLELVVTGGYNDTLSLTAHHGPRVTSGENVTLSCHSVHHFDSFYLFKNGSNVLLQDRFSQSHNTFIIFPVTLTDGGTYRCYGSLKEQPLYWSRPSNPLDLLVTAPLPKPSLLAHPGALVPLDKPVIIQCQGPLDVDMYRLEKLKPRKYVDDALLSIPAMKESLAGQYRCSYQNGTVWSPPSNLLDLIAIGVFSQPTLSARPSSTVSAGGEVTLQCQTPYGFDRFALYKEGDPRPLKTSEMWYQANFPFIAVTAAQSGTYRCYTFQSSIPYLWSHPSDPLELIVKGTPVTPSRLPKKPPSSASAKSCHFPEASRKLNTSPMNKVPTTTGTYQNITVLPKGSDSPSNFAYRNYSKGNMVRVCLGVTVLVLLAGILAEDWHSRKKPLVHRVRAIQRPLPQIPKSSIGQSQVPPSEAQL